MDGRLVLGLINYSILALILIFGLLALIVRNQRKKLTYLFLIFLCLGIISYLFFAGIAFVIPGIVLLFFCVILFLFVFNQEFFGFGKQERHEEIRNASGKDFTPVLLVNLAIAILFCLGIGYLLFIYTRSYYQSVEIVEDFSAIGMAGIMEDIGSNYIPVIFLIVGILTISVIWFIGILKNRGSES